MSAWESFVWIFAIVCLTAIVMQRVAFKHEIAKAKEYTK